MSDKLAFSAALSVLMMSAYVLLGADAVSVPLRPHGGRATPQVSAPALPEPSYLLPSLR